MFAIMNLPEDRERLPNLPNGKLCKHVFQHLALSQLSENEIEKTWQRIQVWQRSVWKQIFKLILQDLVVKSVVSGLEEMRVDWQKSGCNSRYNSYKLLGEKKNRDNLKPWHQVTTSCLTATWGRTFSRWTAGLRSTQSRWTWRWTHLLWGSSSLLLAFTSPPVGWVKAL